MAVTPIMKLLVAAATRSGTFMPSDMAGTFKNAAADAEHAGERARDQRHARANGQAVRR